MADTGFKFSRLGGGGGDDQGGEGKGSQEAFAGNVESRPPGDSSTNPMMTMVLGNGQGARGSVKAVRRTTLLMMALVGVICLLAVVLSGLALSRVMSIEIPEKTWTFALGQSNLVLHYIDGQTLQMDGFDVEMVQAVCHVAGKKCEIVTDQRTNCWTSQKGHPATGGEGLNGGWYDACAGWSQTPERRRAFAFTEPYTKPFPSAFFTLNASKSSFDTSDMQGKKIGFLDGYASDEHCLNRQDNIQGLPLKTEQIFHYLTPADAEAGLKSSEVHAIYTTKYVSMPKASPVKARSFNCSTRGLSVMTRKDSRLEDWWNPAWEQIFHSTYYHVLCQTLVIRHGRFPGLNVEDICLQFT